MFKFLKKPAIHGVERGKCVMLSRAFQLAKKNRWPWQGGNWTQLTLKRMCITFFCQSEICQSGGYWLVLTNNRDEGWDRVTDKAHFWGPNDSCFSAQDQTPGKEGGTWLGMNRGGKVAVLLNILGQNDPTKRGRGSLVSNYISSDVDIHEYAKAVEKEKHLYNGFNLVLFDLGKKEESLGCKPVYISNAAIYPSIVHQRTLPANMFLGLSNSTMEYPFQKVEKGRSKFGEIVMQYSSVTQKPHLIDSLFSMMADRTRCLPDPILERAGAAEGNTPLGIKQKSAINVHTPQNRYGTRTTTVLLIDSQGNVEFVEKDSDFSQNPDQPSVAFRHEKFSLALTDINHNRL